MFSSDRLEKIFNIISTRDYTPMKTLTNEFQITDRTIRTDIQNLNQELFKYDCEILLKRKHGYYLKSNNPKKFSILQEQLNYSIDNISINSLSDRLKYIIQRLLYANDYIVLDDLANEIFISRNTLQNYIKTIKNILENYNLIYIAKPNIGVRIFGNEKDKRSCLVNEILSKDNPSYIIQFSNQEKFLFKGIDLEKLKKIIIDILHSNNIHTSDFEKKNLIIHCAMVISRVKNEDYISYDTNIPIDNLNLIDQICKQIEQNFKIKITTGEKQYIYFHLASNTHIISNKIDSKQLENKINNFLEIIFQEYNFDLRNDSVLKKDLFNHISNIIYSKSMSMNKKNPLLNTIKTNFPLPFEITLTTISKVFDEIISEDEIGYISLHIGAAIERCFSSKYHKKRIILVCGSGIATTRMLEARLHNFFNSKIEIVNKISYSEFENYDFKNIDFVISTIPINSDLIPIEVVDFSLNNFDVEKISRRLSQIDKTTNCITNFFDEKLFVNNIDFNSKNELLQYLANLLKSENIVQDSFLDSVLEREKIASTNMNDIFAIPHPMEPCSNQTKVAAAILNKPVNWSDKHDSVQIVFMISIKSGEQEEFEHLYDIFIEIVNNQKLQQLIINSSSYKEFIEIIKNTVTISN